MSSTPSLNPDDPILRIADVERQTGLKKSTIYALMKANKFPRNIQLGSRSAGWLSSSITAWKQERIAASQEQSS